MTADRPRDEEIWAYIHREMDADERNALEQAFEKDTSLRQIVEDTRSFDRMLRVLCPLTKWTEEDLENRLLDMIEKDEEAEERRGAAQMRGKRSSSILLSPPFRRLFPVVAAAAAILVVAALPFLRGGPVRWAPPDIVPLQYRGSDAAADASMQTQSAAMACYAQLKATVDSSYRQYKRAHPGQKTGWLLSYRFKQLPRGMFAVQVAAHDGKQDHFREWTEYYPSLESCSNQASALAEKIVGELGNIESQQSY